MKGLNKYEKKLKYAIVEETTIQLYQLA